MIRSRIKDLCNKGPHEEAEIQRKTLKREKILAFSEDKR